MMQYSRLIRLPQYFRNFQRLAEILRVLVTHGFGDLVHRLQLSPYLEKRLRSLLPKNPNSPATKLTIGERLKRVCEDLGPTFVKLGQFAATRPDIFPPSLTTELRSLQDQVAPAPFLDVRRTLIKALQRQPEEIFASIEEQPMAAASIAQVYRAELLSGEQVVIKVQRPGILRVIETDLDILRGLATLIEEQLPESRVFSPVKVVDEFARNLVRECDFKREARSIERFKRRLADLTYLELPDPYRDLSTDRVLVERFIEGVRADDLVALRQLGLDTTQVADRINAIVLKSIFEQRFFHADPHPGNILVTATGQIGLVDFGAMGRLEESRLLDILELLLGVFSRDTERMVRALGSTQALPTGIDEPALKGELSELLDNYLGETLGTLQVGSMLTDIYDILHRYQLHVPPDLLLIGKSLTTLEHLGAILDPNFQPLKSIYPYLKELYLKVITNPKTYSRVISSIGFEYYRLATEFPAEVRTILKKLSRQNFTVETIEVEGREKREHQNRLTNRAVMTAIGLALLWLGFRFLEPATNADQNLFAGYLLLSLGGSVLFFVWRAVIRTGGMS